MSTYFNFHNNQPRYYLHPVNKMNLIRNKCGYTNSYSKCNVYLRNNIEMLLIPEDINFDSTLSGKATIARYGVHQKWFETFL